MLSEIKSNYGVGDVAQLREVLGSVSSPGKREADGLSTLLLPKYLGSVCRMYTLEGCSDSPYNPCGKLRQGAVL